MYKLIMAFLFCLTSSIANAQAFQSTKSVICDKTVSIMSALKEKYQEEPIWLGTDIRDDTKYALFVNSKEGSWTLLQFTVELSCILGVGSGSIPVLTGPNT
jgi:hypothetical protein